MDVIDYEIGKKLEKNCMKKDITSQTISQPE